jgi:ABC-type multidrug transport system fused ATPase/permease subunit
MAALSSSGRKLTVLVIAHRLSTLAACNRLVHLEGGRIRNVGTYEEVIGIVRNVGPKAPEA